MSETISKTVLVDSQLSQDECVELRVRSREEQILRELGILYLDSKVTRARFCHDESDAAILKQAGVSYLNTTEYEEIAKEERAERERQKMNDLMKPLSEKEEEVLRSAGVTWLDNMAAVDSVDTEDDNDTYCHTLKCETNTTAMVTVGESTVNTVNTVNSTYAERELLRRLKNGWSSIGEECGECGMPIICQSKGNMYECVICGVVGEEEHYGSDIEDTYYPDADIHVADELTHHAQAHAQEGPGVFEMGTNISSMGPSLDEVNETYDIRDHHSPLEENAGLRDGHMHSDYVERTFEEAKFKEQAGENDDDGDDDMYKEELGLRLFDGWELTESNCLSCNLPLISEGEGSPSICLRCG